MAFLGQVKKWEKKATTFGEPSPTSVANIKTNFASVAACIESKKLWFSAITIFGK